MDLRMGKPTLNAWEIILVVGPLVRRYGERSPTASGLAKLKLRGRSLRVFARDGFGACTASAERVAGRPALETRMVSKHYQ
jgi:hypothetical protein